MPCGGLGRSGASGVRGGRSWGWGGWYWYWCWSRGPGVGGEGFLFEVAAAGIGFGLGGLAFLVAELAVVVAVELAGEFVAEGGAGLGDVGPDGVAALFFLVAELAVAVGVEGLALGFFPIFAALAEDFAPDFGGEVGVAAAAVEGLAGEDDFFAGEFAVLVAVEFAEWGGEWGVGGGGRGEGEEGEEEGGAGGEAFHGSGGAQGGYGFKYAGRGWCKVPRARRAPGSEVGVLHPQK